MGSMASTAIAGWSREKTNKIALQYGAEGFSHSESLKALYREQRRIFAFLIKQEQEQEQEHRGASTNVVIFSEDRK